MKNFYRMASGMDVMPLMVALKHHPELWDQNTLRTRHEGTAHSQVSDIWLRFNEIPDENAEVVVDDKECINYPGFYALPQARALIFALMASVQGERLGRCLITKLTPGKCIVPHTDMGAPATYYERYHIVLQGENGCIFRCGDEKVCMRTGEVWWFDNCQEHEVINNSGEDRIHLIVDIKACK